MADYGFKVPTGRGPGFMVGTLDAQGAGTTDPSFAIVSGNPNDAFRVDADYGVIEVNSVTYSDEVYPITLTVSRTDDVSTLNFTVELGLTVQVITKSPIIYVDPTNGDNSSSGNLQFPLSSFDEAIFRLAGGGTVLLYGGNYGNRTPSGISKVPMTIKALKGHTPVFGDLTFTYSESAVIEGIHFEGILNFEAKQAMSGRRRSSVAVKNCDFGDAARCVVLYTRYVSLLSSRLTNLTLVNNHDMVVVSNIVRTTISQSFWVSGHGYSDFFHNTFVGPFMLFTDGSEGSLRVHSNSFTGSGFVFNNVTAPISFKYNNIFGANPAFGVTPDSTNINKDPMFVDYAGGDYRLQDISPNRGMGDPGWVPESTPAQYGGNVDYTGAHRLHKGPVALGSAVFSYVDGKNAVTGATLLTSGSVLSSGKLFRLESDYSKVYMDDVFNKSTGKLTTCAFWFSPSQDWVDNNSAITIHSDAGNSYFYAQVDFNTTLSSPPNATSVRVFTNCAQSGNYAHEKFFPSAGIKAGEWYYVTLTNEGTYGDVGLNGLTETASQNYTYSNNRSGKNIYIRTSLGAVDIYGLAFWDGDAQYSKVRDHFRLSRPIDSFSGMSIWNLKAPYYENAVFVQRGGYNEIDGLECTLNSVTADGYRLVFNAADHVVLPDVLNKQVGKNTSVGMWVRPSQEWLDNGGLLFLVGNSDEDYQTSYIFPFIYYINDYQDTSRMRVGVDGTGSGTAFQRFYDRSEFVAGRWYYFVFSSENDGEAEFDSKSPFSENNYASPQFRTDTILRLKNVSDGLLEVWGLAIWDGDPVWSTMSVAYPQTTPPDKTEEGYDAGAYYSLSDGSDLKGNYTVPASSVVYNEKFFTITSEFNTGVPINDVRGSGGSGPFAIALKFKKATPPMTRIYFFKNNLGGSSISETLFYWDTDGELYFKDRNFATHHLVNWIKIGGSDTKTTSELLSLADYNSIIFYQNSAGNGRLCLNGYRSSDATNINPTYLSSSGLNWTIDTSESIGIFNVVYYNTTVSDAVLLNYSNSESGSGIFLPAPLSDIATTPDIGALENLSLRTERTEPDLHVGQTGYDMVYSGDTGRPFRKISRAVEDPSGDAVVIGVGEVTPGVSDRKIYTGDDSFTLNGSTVSIGDVQNQVPYVLKRDTAYIQPFDQVSAVEAGSAVYVSPDGDDSGVGTFMNPFRTISRALEEDVDVVFVLAGAYPTFQGVSGRRVVFLPRDDFYLWGGFQTSTLAAYAWQIDDYQDTSYKQSYSELSVDHPPGV